MCSNIKHEAGVDMKTGSSMMILMPIDSIETLEEAELPPGAARAIVRVITNHVNMAVSSLATKDDLEKLRVDMRHEMKSAFAAFRLEMQRQMMRWFLAFLGLLLPAYTSLVYLMFQLTRK
jgi:hypothetical protein